MSLLTPKKLLQPLGILFVGFCLGAGAMYVLPALHPSLKGSADAAIRERGKYKLIAPLLLCGVTDPKDFVQYQPLHDTFQGIIDQAKKDKKISEASVFFRGLSGRWAGINENTPYTPASLLKVPLMIAYLKKAEIDPSVLEKEYLYNGKEDLNADENFKTQNDIKPGVYKVKDLLKAMIVNSDNNAAAMLTAEIDPEFLSDVYTDLGLHLPSATDATAQTISAKEYSYFFRVLYNATYLTPEYSEMALELLDAADFPNGIRAGIPESVNIAQKFGERTVMDQGGAILERDLHDCGLVFEGPSPYLLCVMTKGYDYKNLSSVIESISAAAYETVKAGK